MDEVEKSKINPTIEGNFDSGQGGESPQLLNLSPQELSLYAIPIIIFGRDTISKILNLNWNTRKAGLEKLREFSDTPGDPENICNAVCQILSVTLDDTREHCSKLSIEVLDKLLEYSIIKKIEGILFLNIGHFIKLILLKSCDTSESIRNVNLRLNYIGLHFCA